MSDRMSHSVGSFAATPSAPSPRRATPRQFFVALLPIVLATSVGCGALHDKLWGKPTPAKVGLNTRDLIDPEAQANADRLLNIGSLVDVGSEVKRTLVARAEIGRAHV